MLEQGEILRQSGHPVHFGNRVSLEVSSSFIPICAYKSNLLISNDPLWMSNISFPLCSSFKPTVLEGQLCYKIEVQGTAEQGKVNELMMVLDYNEDRSLTSPFKNQTRSVSSNITTVNLDPAGDYQQRKAKIKIDTLSNYVGFGAGSYRMMNVKRMTATTDFLGMSFDVQKCAMEKFEDCRTKKLLEECNCVPEQLDEYFEARKHVFEKISTLNKCDPKGRDCIQSKSQERYNCPSSCQGIHADLQQEHDNNFEYLLGMVDEYKRFKKSMVHGFDFNSSAVHSEFGKAILSILKLFFLGRSAFIASYRRL